MSPQPFSWFSSLIEKWKFIYKICAGIEFGLRCSFSKNLTFFSLEPSVEQLTCDLSYFGEESRFYKVPSLHMAGKKLVRIEDLLGSELVSGLGAT